MKQKSIKLNAILNVVKQSVGVLFPLITYPYVSRVLGADNIGRYSFSDSVIQILITLSTIGIPTYAIREGALIRDKKDKLKELSSELFTINLITVLLSYIAIAVMVLTIDRFRVEYVFIMILSVNVMSRCLGRDWINSIYEDFLFISIRYLVIHIVSLVCILLFVKKPEDLLKYVIIMAMSEFLGNMLNVFYTNKRIPAALRFSKEMFRHLKPVLILFCSSVATTIYVRSDIVILGFLRPNDDVGVYTFSSKAYLIVKNIINAVIIVAIPRLAFYLGKEDEEGKVQYKKLLNNLRNTLLLILFPAAVGLGCLSSEIMYFLGKTEFQRGESALKILCIALMFTVFGGFFSHAVLIVNRREKAFFQATIISAILNISLNFVFIPLLGIDGAAITTAISELCILVYCGVAARKYYPSDNSKLLKYTVTTILECIIIVALTIFFKKVTEGLFLRVALIIATSLLAYLVILIITRNEILLSGLGKVKKRMKS